MDFPSSREIHLDLDLIEEPMEWTDVDDQPTPTIKLRQAHECAQALSNFALESSLEFSIIDVLNMQSFMDKMNKMSIFNIN